MSVHGVTLHTVMDAAPAYPVSSDQLATHALLLARAAAEQVKARIRYRDARGLMTDRDISVLGLAWRHDTWVFYGHCSLRSSYVLFRVDRVLAAELTTTPSIRIESVGFDRREFAAPATAARPDAVPVRLRFVLRAPAGRAASVLFPTALVEHLPSGDAVCHLQTSSLRRTAWMLHSLSPHVVPQGPTDLIRIFHLIEGEREVGIR